MRLTDFCNRLPVTSTNGLLDSRSHTLVTSPSCDVSPHACAWLHPGPKPSARRDAARLWAACRFAHRMNQPGGASLDGEPPASTILATTRSSPQNLSRGLGAEPPSRRTVRRCAVLVESRSLTPPQQCLPATVLFAPGRACDIASDVLCRDPRRARHLCRAPSALGPPDPLP